MDNISHIEPGLGPAGLARLVQRCPALQLLSIPGLVQPGVGGSALAAFTALTALTSLTVGEPTVDDAAASGTLSALTGLRCLQMYCVPQMTDRGLLSLSALRKLTHLEVADSGVSKGVSWVNYNLMCLGVEFHTDVSSAVS